MTINVRGAVSAARSYLSSLQDMIGPQIEDLRLEEVELSEDKTFWLVTLGFSRPTDKDNNPLGDILTLPKPQREYKVFKVDAETGEVQSMKIREV